jgi:5,5'-dehydrodivanillate O-demethylase
MLSVEDNKLLTEVGPGKPMGDLLRRYWQPVCALDEILRARFAPRS